MARVGRRRFLESALALPLLPGSYARTPEAPLSAWHRESSVLASLRAGQALPEGLEVDLGKPRLPARPLFERFPDLDRRFIFEYYPWYGRDPWRHWNADDRRPPHDIAAVHVPRLSAYDSRDRSVLEQHARWIRESGAGSIAISWWGPESFEDRAAHTVMDVMRDYGIGVTFGLEPYADDRGSRFAADVLYLLREYGEKRGWDAFLLLRNEDGTESPVLKGFRCILPETIVDCHAVTQRVSDFTPDAVWRPELARIRQELRWDFDRVVLLADSLDFGRTVASGFDGIGIYDNFIGPERYAPLAREASAFGLLFSFNVNPGYDEVVLRDVPDGSCYEPRPFAPPAPDSLDFRRTDHRELADALSARRVAESLRTTVEIQNEPGLTNHDRGFFVAYVNSFNEWHEGHAFEPMKDEAELTSAQRARGYHNPLLGDTRIRTLGDRLRPILAPPKFEEGRRADSARTGTRQTRAPAHIQCTSAPV